MTAPSPKLLALLAECKEKPHEDAPRLILADWLEEHGQAERGEYIRLQMQIRQLPEEHPQRDALCERGQALWQQYHEQWGNAWKDMEVAFDSSDGLIGLDTGIGELATPMFSLVEEEDLAWVEQVHLEEVDDPPRIIRQVMSSRAMTDVTALDVYDANLTPTRMRALLEPLASHLRQLTLTYGMISTNSLRSIFEIPELLGLRKLELNWVPLGKVKVKRGRRTPGTLSWMTKEKATTLRIPTSERWMRFIKLSAHLASC